VISPVDVVCPLQVLAFAVLMTLLLMVPPMIWPKISKINLVPTASLADPE
jgi:hypothetical protein